MQIRNPVVVGVNKGIARPQSLIVVVDAAITNDGDDDNDG